MNFDDMTWLFTCDNRNRGLIRMNFDEAALLWKAVIRSSGPILEIGRRYGGSACLIRAASRERPLFSLDLEPSLAPQCEQFLRQFDSNTHLLIADSRHWSGAAEIGLLVIDGDHSLPGVLGDTCAHWDRLTMAGIALYHDALPNPGLEWREGGSRNFFPGVQHVVQSIVRVGAARPAASAGSSQMLIKTADLPGGFASTCAGGFGTEAAYSQ